METTDYKKMAENIEVISAVLKKTSCDIVEISSMFIWIGIITAVRELSTVLLMALSLRAEGTFSHYMSVMHSLAFISFAVIFVYYFRKCRKRNNPTALQLMEIWGILLFAILPVLTFIFNRTRALVYASFMDALAAGMAVNVNASTQLALWRDGIQILFILVGIFIVGSFAANRKIKRTAFMLILCQLILACICAVFDSAADYMTVFRVINLSIESIGLILCGIMLRTDRRKAVHGIE